MLKLFALLQALWLAACPSSGELIRDFTGKGVITFAKPIIVHAHIYVVEYFHYSFDLYARRVSTGYRNKTKKITNSNELMS